MPNNGWLAAEAGCGRSGQVGREDPFCTVCVEIGISGTLDISIHKKSEYDLIVELFASLTRQ
jgi:hypothetical protein